jgi:23S rRNA pseudouridine2605 synthase
MTAKHGQTGRRRWGKNAQSSGQPILMHSSAHTAKRVGLARALSKMGLCSRAEAAELIRAGRVALNGKVRRDPETPVRLGFDALRVDGNTLEAAARIYWMLNKPRGVVTTASDEKGRPTVYDYLSEQTAWVAPVGRLDKASEGLLLLSNDSEWAARILAPETHLEKTYRVQVATLASDALLENLRRGIRDGGELLRATRVSLLRSGARNCWLEIVLEEGKNRQIRRMLDSLGVEVLRLVRVAIGPLALGDLPKGKVRALTAAEKLAIDRSL